jgi:MOSC domain-containing protein YiiM
MGNQTNKLGSVIEIFSADKNHKAKVRPIVGKLELIKDHGIKNDKFAEKNLESTVMIIGKNAYDLAKSHDINLEYGSLGENILLDFDPNLLSVGTILTIGNSKIQITQKCTICNHLSHYDDDLPRLIKNDRGMYCKIIQSGSIFKNMEVGASDD